MLPNKFIAKIEGHGNLEIDWQKEQVSLQIHEGERLFEGLLVGRTIEESHWITPRICGVCPIAHNLASLKACENGLQIKINETTELLRELMICAQMMQSHMLHLFFLALPDYLNIDRGTELHAKNPTAFKAALDIKEVSDQIAIVVAGRNVHPTTTTIGGFHKIPTRQELKNLLEKIKKTRKSAQYTLKLCSQIEYPHLQVDLELVAQQNDKILSSKIDEAPIKLYKEIITEEIKNNSTAKFGKYKNREVMVGSLARMYFLASSEAEGHNLLDFQNPFHNNLAQAIEILLYHKKAEELLTQLVSPAYRQAGSNFTPELVRSNLTSSKGIGAVEAPRGGLYHELHFDQKGVVTYANIITPTVQNLTSIEKSATALLKENLPRAKSRGEMERLLNMLVRAYDPCITCSVH